MTESEKLKIIKNLEDYLSKNLIKENLFHKSSGVIFKFESGIFKTKTVSFEADFEENSRKHDIEEKCDEFDLQESSIFSEKISKKHGEDFSFLTGESPLVSEKNESLLDKVKNLFSDTESTFQERLFEIIRERKIDEVKLYTKAQLTKQTFSKIRSNKDYKPMKNTAFLLVLALNLNLEEAENLLSRAGIAFSPSDKFDLAIKFFIENKIYDIFEINEILMQSGIKTLAG